MTKLPLPIQAVHRKSSLFMVGLLFFYGLLSWSMLLNATGLGGAIISPVVIVLLGIFCILQNRPPKKWFLVLFGLIFSSAVVGAYLWKDFRLLTQPVYILVALALISSATISEVGRFVDWATNFMYLVLAGAIIGFFLALLGVPPLFSFQYGDDHNSYFYVTTFTNEASRYMRPAGIYDEPGALSFVVCILAFMRKILNRNGRQTWLLLWFGFITFSLAHILFVALYFVADRFSIKNTMLAVFAFPAVLTIGHVSGLGDAFNERVIKRLQFDETGQLSGDNRSYQYDNALLIIENDPQLILKGLGPDCLFSKGACRDTFGYYGTNPLSPLVGLGLINSWPYYAFVIVGLVGVFRPGVGILFFGVTLLFLQRPYLLSLGYSLLGVVSMWLYLNSKYIQRLPSEVSRGQHIESS